MHMLLVLSSRIISFYVPLVKCCTNVVNKDGGELRSSIKTIEYGIMHTQVSFVFRSPSSKHAQRTMNAIQSIMKTLITYVYHQRDPLFSQDPNFYY